ncbi:MAG: type II secretion system protein [Cyanobacteriota bacterium]
MNFLTRLGARSCPNRFELEFAFGFTLVEKILVMAIIGILMAIAAPSWITFFRARSLNAAQDKVFQTIRLAQIQAEQTRASWQFSIRTDSYGFVQIAAHRMSTPPEQILWYDLDPRIQLHPTEMTLYQTGGIYRVQFNHQGRVIGQLGRVTLIQRNDLQIKRCVTVSTLLGVVRKGCPSP